MASKYPSHLGGEWSDTQSQSGTSLPRQGRGFSHAPSFVRWGTPTRSATASETQYQRQRGFLPTVTPFRSLGTSPQSLSSHGSRLYKQGDVLPLQQQIKRFNEPSQSFGYNRPGRNTFSHVNDPLMKLNRQSQPVQGSGLSSLARPFVSRGTPVQYPRQTGFVPNEHAYKSLDTPPQSVSASGGQHQWQRAALPVEHRFRSLGTSPNSFTARGSQLSGRGDVYPLPQRNSRLRQPPQSVIESGFGSTRQRCVQWPKRSVDTTGQAVGTFPVNTECRCESYDLYMIGTIGNDYKRKTKPTADFQSYDFDTKTWSRLTENSYERIRKGFAVAALGAELWVLGGTSVSDDGWEYLRDRVSIYCIQSGTWRRSKVEMLYKRADLCAAVVGDRLYAIGGRCTTAEYSEESSNVVEMFIKESRCTIAPMKIGRSSFGSCVVGERIYVAGGVAWNSNTRTVEYYSTKWNKQWTFLEIKMPNVRTSFGLVYVNDNLYAVGGDGDRSVIHKYMGVPGGQWFTDSITLQTELWSYDVLSVGGEIYVLGKTNTDEGRFCKFRPTDSSPEWDKLPNAPFSPWNGGVRVSLVKNRPCENDENASFSRYGS